MRSSGYSIIITVFLYFSSLAVTEIVPDDQDENENICNSTECIKYAEMMKDNMDCTVDPCEDFFQYACGGFIKKTVLTDDKPGTDFLLDSQDIVYSQCKQVLENNDEMTPLRYVRQAKFLYNQCMDTAATNANGVEPLRQLLKKFGEWPLPDVDPPADLDWFQTYSDVHKAGFYNYLFSFGVYQDPKIHTRRLLDIDQPKFGVDMSYLRLGRNNSFVQAYHDFLVKSATLLGADEAMASRVLNESLNFELKLAGISLSRWEQYNDIEKTYNLRNVPELAQYPNLRLEEYLKKVLSPRITISEKDKVNLDNPYFISELDNLIKNTSSRVIINYLLSRVVRDAAPYVNDAMREVEFRLTSKFSGTTKRYPRWYECVELVNEKFGIALGAMYIRHYYNDEKKAEVVRIVSDLKKELRKRIELIDWMDEQTRAIALEKLDAMSVQIAYPEELRDDAKVEEYYKEVKLSSVYLESVSNLSVLAKNKMYDSLRKPVVKNDWTDYAAAATVNAYYHCQQNAIWFPASILQNKIFEHDRPGFTNYAGLGFAIGHEMTHGFDNVGRQFDKNGNVADWWNNATADTFKKRSECILNQYNNYAIKQTESIVNGAQTLTENIADNGGGRIAFNAYMSYLKEHPEDKRKLPGIDMTFRQQFWLSFANLWCSKYTDEFLSNQIRTDDHSPSEARINIPFSNMKEFSEDFNCPPTSTMNENNKCLFW